MTTFSFGPVVLETGVLFRLWAPLQEHVDLDLVGHPPVRMRAADDGWHLHEAPEASVGSRYRFILEDGTVVPDPASRYQPEDVHGPSEVMATGFDWRCRDWRGRPWEESVIYELHIGSFTPLGTFLGAIAKLDHLRDLGVTAIQVMPIADFPGKRNWGYDGVLPYAPDGSYGRPEDLKAFVDAAHLRGMSVFLDVVYNHFGPDGNYLAAYAPLFTEDHHTPWGAGINYDGDNSRMVRDFIVENPLYWLEEFRIDGLRLDAVHAIKDDSREHLLLELARRVREVQQDRFVHLIVENEDNDSSLLSGGSLPERPYTAQWNDDVHHVLHVAATGEDFGYYADYAGQIGHIGRGLAEGFVYQGETMSYRGSARGKPSADLPPTAFIAFIQNHDQIGNRAFGDRLSETAQPSALRAAAATYLLSPQIPMVFMGEEWASQRPFPFFCDFSEDLNEIVRQGRRKELSRLPGFDEESAAGLPDPTDEAVFLSAKLDWENAGEGEHAGFLDFYRRLIALRHKEIVPRLRGIGGHAGSYNTRDGVVHVAWTMGDGSSLKLVANLSAESRPGQFLEEGRRLFLQGGISGSAIEPWSVLWSIDEKPVG